VSAVDVAVIGAGPAGLAAAAIAAGAGLDTVLFDENPGPGGQVYRAITSTPLQDRSVLGADFWTGQSLVERAQRSGARLQHATTVWSLDSELEVGVMRDGAARMIPARHVIIATGALERPFPIPGWTLPGVMTAGAAQTLLKASGAVAGGAVVLAGMGPLLWLLAAQTLRAGGRIAAILDTTPPGAYRAAAADFPAFLVSPLFRKGLALLREVRRQVKVIGGVDRLVAEGDDRVRAVVYRTASGRQGRIEVEHLFLHQGVVPNVNLAMAAGVEHRWSDLQLCFAPVVDAFGGTSVPGLAVAGDGAGIAGAWAAEARGRLAAIAAVRRLVGSNAPGASEADEREARAALRRGQAGRAFLDRVYRPPAAFRVPDGDTVVCRCEEVTAAQIVDTAALGCEGPNQMKAFLRCGMGPCQGRLCGLTVTELIASARRSSPQAVGYYRLRPPVKPIPLSALANMPVDEPSVKAVVRE
jgi:NADPH-dependent 2,4-dienoyl-CoA reductase/sulfur reductase-like enzyme